MIPPRHLSETLLQHASSCVRKKRIVERKSTHSWLNEAVLQAVADKRDAEGTPGETEKAKACSSAFLREYNGWVSDVHKQLASMKQGSKNWLKVERQLQLQKQRCSSIPALKHGDGTWTRDSKGKADVLATTLSSKYTLAECQSSEYSTIKDERLTGCSIVVKCSIRLQHATS